MIRKQIFIEERQNEELKQLALKTGKSEGQLIREAVDRQLLEQEETELLWKTMIDRWLSSPTSDTAEKWQRNDLYEDRLRKFDADSH